MSNRSKRGDWRGKPPPRPQLINEQLRQQVLDEFGGQIPHVLPRDFCIYVVHKVAMELEQQFVGNERMPWVQANIEKRTDGFSLHVQVVEPSDENDAVVL